MLVATDVDALCASHMLADLFSQDDIIYRIMPVSGLDEFERVKEELKSISELHTLILINMGGVMDLPSSDWFGEYDTKVIVHVIDSARPLSLPSLFSSGDNGNRIVVWDDGGAEKLEDIKKSWEVLQYEPELDSDEDSDDNESLEDHDVAEDDSEDGDQSGRKRSIGSDSQRVSKRPRLSADVREQMPPKRISRDERDEHLQRLDKYYMAGTWYGQSASNTIFILASALERVDNDMLWLAILGLTYQFSTSRISREKYEFYHTAYVDEVSRLNPLPPDSTNSHSLILLNPDDVSVRSTDELRFMLFRHWTLYDAMYHSSYVAGRLGIWKERGRKRLTGLLAKMGFSIPQTQQPYAHMDMDLKRILIDRLNEVAPEYGLVDLSYPSFLRCYGYHTQPLSAADAVEGISALLDVAGGVRMEIEVEGTRNGGEWFGRGVTWETKSRKRRDEDGGLRTNTGETKSRTGENGTGDSEEEAPEERWWIGNFWTAYDALNNIEQLQESLRLSMSLHRAIIRQGTSIIDKQDIRTMRNCRVVVLAQGPDLDLFAHGSVLSRLALWLVDALRDRMPGTNMSGRSKRESLPFVVACLNEKTQTYIVVGVMAALDLGEVRKNEFGLAFLDAKDRCNARTRYNTFDTSVLEIDQADLKKFLEALSEGPSY
ncbi:hypothetical protein AMATHDRAFT_61914 [Amanita thiersii Skay4041]|uniref:CDC45-like protein n=1 Tax=Amanita thiersii Skay4041 TaxID=703135 RepID=A0A2A9NP99_9AGAR|nr:hypothetical protein AMATHDRAFT_61914 [Amanita thiersii Skay4041]